VVKAGGDSALTVLIAFAANLLVALAKTFAAVLSSSASMTAEAAHSWADTGNEVFLLVANRRSIRDADERRPLGYGREAYVWSLLAAVGLFVIGAAVSIWRGVTELLQGAEGGEDYRIREPRLRVRNGDVGPDGAGRVRGGLRRADRHRDRIPRHPAAPADR
jgi:divalent metal cation (Fe/Co/Zn/Cd) transporter